MAPTLRAFATGSGTTGFIAAGACARPDTTDTASATVDAVYPQVLFSGGVCSLRSRRQSLTSAQPAQIPSAARLAHTETGTNTMAKTNMIHARIVIPLLPHALRLDSVTLYFTRVWAPRQAETL
jgi:hypothetical protein